MGGYRVPNVIDRLRWQSHESTKNGCSIDINFTNDFFL